MWRGCYRYPAERISQKRRGSGPGRRPCELALIASVAALLANDWWRPEALLGEPFAQKIRYQRKSYGLELEFGLQPRRRGIALGLLRDKSHRMSIELSDLRERCATIGERLEAFGRFL